MAMVEILVSPGTRAAFLRLITTVQLALNWGEFDNSDNTTPLSIQA
jgi:hypothetical protein